MRNVQPWVDDHVCNASAAGRLFVPHADSARGLIGTQVLAVSGCIGQFRRCLCVRAMNVRAKQDAGMRSIYSQPQQPSLGSARSRY